jgi:hypothetical protein
VFDLAAVAVEDAIAEVDTLDGGLFDEQQLVGANAEVPVSQRAHALGRECDRLAVAVEHDEVVAGAVHLGEFELHGLRLFLAACAFPVATPACGSAAGSVWATRLAGRYWRAGLIANDTRPYGG